MKEQQRAKLNRERDKSDPLKYARVKELNRLSYIIFLNFFLHLCSCSSCSSGTKRDDNKECCGARTDIRKRRLQ